VPQAHNSNAGPWEKLETYSRTLAQQGKELFVIAGGILGSSSKKVGSGVVVPDETFKVVVVLDHPGQGAAAVTTSTRVIAVAMPNDDSKIWLSGDWKPYRVSVRTIEQLTGFNFLSDVEPAVQDVIENQVDSQ